jgi:hypothetical protein
MIGKRLAISPNRMAISQANSQRPHCVLSAPSNLQLPGETEFARQFVIRASQQKWCTETGKEKRTSTKW